jgi:TonB family protein
MALMACDWATGPQSRRSSARMRRPASWLAVLGLVASVALQAQPAPAEQSPPAPASASQEQPATDVSPPAQDAAADGDAVSPDALVSRFEANDAFGRLVADQKFAAAVPVGKRLAELTEQEFGKRSRETADVYAALGDAERHAGDHDGAEKSYLEAIDVYRSVDGVFTPLVIGPLTSMGENYDEAGQYLNAVSAYSEARTVNRRTFGLLNEEQIPLLDHMTQSLVALNDLAEADKQQLEALHLIQRNWPPDSDRSLAATYKYAAWLQSRGRFQEERDTYAQALRAITDASGENDPRRVEPLRGIANSFRSQGIPEPQGIGSLNQALEVLDAHQPRDDLATAEVLRDIGDWNVAFDKVDYAGEEYRRAWQLLGDVDNGEKVRADWFRGANYVLREPISLRDISEERNAPQGHVVAKFDLDTSGRPSNVVIVESDPPGLKDEAVLRAVRRSRFRPQMLDGELVSGQGLGLRFTYRYTTDESDTRKKRKNG